MTTKKKGLFFGIEHCFCKCCCTPENCKKEKVHEWSQAAAGIPYMFPEDVLCNKKYCSCQKAQIVALRTNPAFGGYPRVVRNLTIKECDQTAKGSSKCCIDGLRDGYLSHLGLKGYTIWYELWVMCNKKPDGSTEEYNN